VVYAQPVHTVIYSVYVSVVANPDADT